MKRLSRTLLSVSILAMMPVIAGAAGTYYNGNTYQNPQRYGKSGGGYYNSYAAGRGQNQNTLVRNSATRTVKKSDAKANSTKQGFHLGANFTHEMANWDFEMKSAKSNLRYDNLAWNVLSAEMAYYFGSSVPVQIKAGGRYGMQFGETAMIDDDISNGAYGTAPWTTGTQAGYAMSVGTSKDGVQYGFNASLGLTDFFKVGRVKITPSLGYRYFKHKLNTNNNSGLTTDVFYGNSSHDYINCINVGGETQCDPFVMFEFYKTVGGSLVSLGTAVTGRLQYTDGSLTDIIFDGIPAEATAVSVNLGDTYYYHQSGDSHKYETLWHGPYLALDMEYDINSTNSINAGLEIGLPIYKSTGDQPYRVDWAHPTSVEDKGDFGKAYHIGLNAVWSTAITDSTMLSLGMTYDYYRVNGATATTYLNSRYYTDLYEVYENLYETGIAAGTLTEAQQESLEASMDEIAEYKTMGWKLESKDEINSVYKSIGMRLGISVKF